MNKTVQRIVTLLLVLLMTCGMFPAALATDIAPEDTVTDPTLPAEDVLSDIPAEETQPADEPATEVTDPTSASEPTAALEATAATAPTGETIPTDTEPTVPVAEETVSAETEPTDPPKEESTSVSEMEEEVTASRIGIGSANVPMLMATRAAIKGTHYHRAIIWLSSVDSKLSFTYNNRDFSVDRLYVHGVIVDGKRYVGYCVDPGILTTESSGGYSGSETAWTDLDIDTQTAVGLAVLYGAPNGMSSSTKKTMLTYEFATQIIIHEILLGYYAYLYVAGYGYPTQAGLSWLSPLVELGDGISISYFLSKKRKEQILPKVAKTTMFNRSRMRDVEDTRADFEEMDDAISSGMYIKEQMNREGEEFFYMNTLIEVTAYDPETLEQRIKQVQNRCASMNMTIRRADYCHEQCFMSMLPLCKLDPDIERKSRRNVLTQGAAAAFPFSSFELCDDKGILMGINLHNNSAVILDNFNSDIYSNGNMAIFGMTGAGKTYTILLMAMRLRMIGVQVFVIAPEKGFEYQGPCEALGGQYIKLARGSTDCINIMDIRRTTMDIDDNLQGHDSRKDSVMLDVVQDVKTYFQLRYPAMTPEERYLLNTAIIECYGKFGITRDNATLLNPDGSFKVMPTLADLYPIVSAIPELKNIAIIIKDLVESGLGGRTNVDLRSGFTVIDTSASREEDLAATTFLATVFFRDEMSKSRTRKKAVFGDELWIIAGKEGNEQASEFVIKLVKTIRGYGGIFVPCTQNTIDYFAMNNGKFGDAVLNNCRLKLLLQMEEPEALKLQEKIGLSDEEVMQILRCGRGQGLLCAGKNRIAVEIRSSQTQYDLITTKRADLEKREKGGQ